MPEDIGFVYLSTVNGRSEFVKIGMTHGDVETRMQQLTKAADSYGKHESKYSRRVENPGHVERNLHEKFHFCLMLGATEYFVVNWQAVKPALDAYPNIPSIVPRPDPIPPPDSQPPEDEQHPQNEFIRAIQAGKLPRAMLLIEQIGINLSEIYGWEDVPDGKDVHGNLRIGKLLALNPNLLMGHQGRPFIKFLMLKFIRENPGINSTPIYSRLGIRTMAVGGGHNDFFAFAVMNELKAQDKVKNMGPTGKPQWHIVEKES